MDFGIQLFKEKSEIFAHKRSLLALYFDGTFYFKADTGFVHYQSGEKFEKMPDLRYSTYIHLSTRLFFLISFNRFHFSRQQHSVVCTYILHRIQSKAEYNRNLLVKREVITNGCGRA